MPALWGVAYAGNGCLLLFTICIFIMYARTLLYYTKLQKYNIPCTFPCDCMNFKLLLHV